MKEKELVVGEILKPQGIRGEVKIKPFTDDAETFSRFSHVLVGGADHRVLSVRTGGGFVYLGLRGVTDRNAAELLRGKEVAVPRDEAPDPGEGRYYIADLLGCTVEDETGAVLGKLTGVTKAATDVYALDADGKEVLFPAAAGVVLRVEPSRGRIVVDAKRFEEVAVR